MAGSSREVGGSREVSGSREEGGGRSREEMYAQFQPWVLATYGDSAKTKTITLRKAARIRALLRTTGKVTPFLYFS